MKPNRSPRRAAALLVVLLASGVIDNARAAPPAPAPNAATTPPAPPFALVAPSIEPLREQERQRSPASLFEAAREAALLGDHARTVRLAAASVATSGRGHLLLVRAHLALGQIDAACYWLQRGVKDEGIDLHTIEVDPLLVELRRDSRWTLLRKYVDHSSRYWADRGKPATVVRGHLEGGAKPRNALVWLHPNGEAPDDDLERVCGPRVRGNGAVCLAISGPIGLGPKTFRWATDPETNRRHLAAALDHARGSGMALPRSLILVGLNEGGQAALETAPRDPARFRGAIAMSPHGLGWRLELVHRDPHIDDQRYVIAFSSFASWPTVGSAYLDADLLRRLGATVHTRPAWLRATNGLPPDVGKRMPEWVEEVCCSKRVDAKPRPR